MKKIILFSLLLILSASSFSQQTISKPVLTKQDYLQKSKDNKAAAWVCLGLGALFIGIAAPGTVSLDIAGVLVIGGGVLVVSSIPLFIAGSRNKRKSRTTSAFLKMETAPVIRQSATFSKTFPAVSVKISL